MLMESAENYGRNLNHSTLKNKIEKSYYDLDNSRYKGELGGNILVDKKSRISRIVLSTRSVIGFGNNTDLVHINDWHEIVPWLNTGTDRTSYDSKNMKRFSARRRDGPIDGNYTLIAERYKRRPVYHGPGLPLDGEIIPFCPVWIHAEQAEFQFISDSYALASDSRGNAGGIKNGLITLDDVDMTLNDVFVETSPEFDKKNPGESAAIAGVLLVGGLIFPIAFVGVVGLGFAVGYGIKALIDGAEYNKNKIHYSVGEFNVSFCGHLPRGGTNLLHS